MLRSAFKVLSFAMLGFGALAGQAQAGVLLQDNFDSGQKAARSAYTAYWSDNTDTVSLKTSALAFRFPGGAASQDAWAEQRVKFPSEQEIWANFRLFIPSNYYHRNPGAANNKFFAIFNNAYRPGFQVNFSMEPDSNGNSRVDIRYYSNGVEQSSGRFAPSGGWPILINRSTDAGKWINISMHFKVPSAAGVNDGIMELSKNGTSLISIRNLNSHGTSGLNYMDEAYILGWSNSGFDQTTELLVDDFVIADTPIGSSSTAPAASPMPPGNVSITVD
jgi:hypothetical protein